MRNLFGFRSVSVLIFTAFLVCISAVSAGAAGFALIEQSASGLGNAYAGGAASAEDASTVFFNPAGMTLLGGQQLSVAGHIIAPSAKFQNEGSTHVLQSATGIPLLGDNGGDGGVTKVVPNAYYTRKLTDRLVIGLGINAPFGLATDYDQGWVGRYHALESDVLTVNINPSVAYKVTDRLSVGAGLNVQYFKAKLSNAIDFGTLDVLGKLGLPAGALHLVPQLSDGFVRLEGDSWGVGYNLGVLYEFTKDTRAGIAYRSRIKHTLEGDADFSNVPAGLAPVPVFKNTGVKADITVPDSLSVSVFHSLTPEWKIMADFTWTNWSLFKELRVRFDNPNQPDAATTENWQDSYRYSLGLTYTPNPTWTFRTGVAYDTSAVADAQHRTPRIPDNNRIWTAIGLGYRVSQAVSVDLGYAHLFINNAGVDKSPTGEDAVRGGLKGTYDLGIDIVSAQINLRF
jgi:long-chain fatty acid transport protein